MVVALDNKPGWRCETCHEAPSTWWAVTCPKGCGFKLFACGRCASQAQVEEALAAHVEHCSQDLGEPPSAVEFMKPKHHITLTRQAARTGATVGGTLRGKNGAVLGGALGAALGAVTSHILNQPEIQPLVNLVRVLTGPAREIIEVARAVAPAPVEPAVEAEKKST